ncbi:MAG TPA: ATP-binding protein [Acidimicrobiales bacterium]|nr:ATP-binding protein [Acidimicrobiales bacterium]
MVLSTDEFAEMFPGEGDYVEFKQGLGIDALREAVTAFSNADGGVIAIGVSDDGHIHGHNLTGEALAKIHRLISEVHQAGRYDIRSVPVGQKSVTFLAVDRRREGFGQDTNGAVLVRRGASNIRLFGAELGAFMAERRLSRFEATKTDVRLNEVDATLLDRLAAAWGWGLDGRADRLVEHGLIERDREPRLTVAGALYLLDDPSSVLGKSFIEVYRFPQGARDYDKRTAIHGPVNVQVEDATNQVMNELGAELVVLGLRRYELDRIPRSVLREAIANAVAHRDYESTGTAVRIEIRPDRVVIASPGGLPEPVTVRNIREQQAARNLATIDTLRRFRLAEDAGRGVDLMEDDMLANMLQKPVFVDSGTSVTVELLIGSTVAPAERAWLLELEQRGEVGPEERILLVHAARNESLTNSMVRDILGMDSVDARSLLQRLRDGGFLSQSGTKGGAVYRLAGDLAPPAGLRLSPEQLADLIEELAQERPITNAVVREHTGLDRTDAIRLLNDLVRQGRLVQTGSRRGTRYVLPGEDETQLPLR